MVKEARLESSMTGRACGRLWRHLGLQGSLRVNFAQLRRQAGPLAAVCPILEFEIQKVGAISILSNQLIERSQPIVMLFQTCPFDGRGSVQKVLQYLVTLVE